MKLAIRKEVKAEALSELRKDARRSYYLALTEGKICCRSLHASHSK